MENISMIYRDHHYFPRVKILRWILENISGALEYIKIPAFEEGSIIIIIIDTDTRSVVPAEHAYTASKSMFNSVLSMIGNDPVYQTTDYRADGFLGSDHKTYQFISIPAAHQQ